MTNEYIQPHPQQLDAWRKQARQAQQDALAQEIERKKLRETLTVRRNGETSEAVVKRYRTGQMAARAREQAALMQLKAAYDIDGAHEGVTPPFGETPEGKFAQWMYKRGIIGEGTETKSTDTK